MILSTSEGFCEFIAQRIQGQQTELSARWLDRLNALLAVSVFEVFPSEQLLDHVPALIHEIGQYLCAPDDQEIAANTAVIEKAREFGMLRYQQQASVHQLLREYDILGGILESFVAEETERVGSQPSAGACFQAMRRITHAVRILMQATVDTFVEQHTATLERQKRTLENFNRMAGHELRTPTATLMFAVDLLDTGQVAATNRPQLIRTIRRNAQRLVDLVEALQRLALAEGAADGPTKQVVELTAAIQEAARQLREMAQSRGVEVRIQPDLPEIVVDAARFELVMLNLLSNAIKYSDPSKAERFVAVTLEPERSDGSHITLCVRDNGLGVPKDAVGAIFDRFFRAHVDRDKELGIEGTGLGLAIVLECVRALNGSIACESKPGEGSAFFLRLPVQKLPAPTTERTTSSRHRP
jgi:signal transduction histidine kinase